MTRRPFRLSSRRLEELRIAGLRRWREGDNIEKVAKRVGVPGHHMAAAFDEPVTTLLLNYRKGVTAAELASEFDLPEPFVRYCFRWFSATAAAKKARSSRGGSSAVKNAPLSPGQRSLDV